MTKYVAYWASLFGLLGLALWLKNRKQYRDKTWKWYSIKSLIELVVIGLAAFWFPVVLVVYVVNWILTSIFQTLNHRTLVICINILLTVTLSIIATFAMEVIMIGSIFGIGRVSEEFLFFLEERRQKREQELISSVAWG